MSKARITARLLAAALFTLTLASFARAQAPRTWVSGVGDDLNVCSRTAPCKTFAGALNKTNTGGEIDLLDSGGYGAVTITKSITINGEGFLGGITNSNANGINVNFDSFAVGDTLKSVQLLKLSIQGGGGATPGTRGIRISGGATITGGFVAVEDCVIEGDTTAPGRGIEDARSGGGQLRVSNTTFQNLSGTAISQIIVGSTRVDWTIDNVRIFNCSFGVAAGSGSRVLVTNSVISGCTNAGLYDESPSGTSEMHVENTVSTNNGTGVQVLAGGTVRLSNSTITFNGTGISGTALSYGNNMIAGNTSAGTSPTAVGPASSPFGQQ
jgi:Right handed beta helix region